MKKIAVIWVGIFICLLFVGCDVSGDEPISASNFQLNTVVAVDIYDSADESIFQEVFAEIDRLERLLSVDYPGSDLERLSQNSGKDFIEVSPETILLLQESKEYYRLSQGAFDVTTGPLISLWDIRDGQGYFPSAEELGNVLPLVNSENLLIDSSNQQALLKEEGMKAHLGAIAKGYIADRVKVLLQSKGIESAVINLGGNVLLIGGKPNGDPFRVGVQDPLATTGAYLGIVDMEDKSLVSSGTYERFFLHEDKAYHHILDPATGYPVENELLQVTIISDISAAGDGFSTTALLLGLDEGLALIDSIPDVSAIFVTKDKKIYFSGDIEEKFTLVDQQYTLVTR